MTATTRMTGMPTTLARPRALTAVCSATTAWPGIPAASHPSTDLRPVSYNSIVRSDVVLRAATGRDGFGAKQAAPPRGVPR